MDLTVILQSRGGIWKKMMGNAYINKYRKRNKREGIFCYHVTWACLSSHPLQTAKSAVGMTTALCHIRWFYMLVYNAFHFENASISFKLFSCILVSKISCLIGEIPFFNISLDNQRSTMYKSSFYYESKMWTGTEMVRRESPPHVTWRNAVTGMCFKILLRYIILISAQLAW